MGYQIVAGTAHETLSDEVWLDLIAMAAKHGYSAPRLGQLWRYENIDLTEEEAAGLYAALERALTAGEPQEYITTEDDVLDHETVRRVSYVLRQPGLKMLRRTPTWP
jgi:methylase of polypeptide subunit release factors